MGLLNLSHYSISCVCLILNYQGMEKQEIDYQLRNQLFERFITPHFGYVYRICISKARAPDDIPELVNEVLIKLLKGVKTYNPSLHILPWIYTVAIRCIGQIYLKRKLICADYVDINSIPPSKLYSDEEILEGNYELLSPDMAVAVEMLKPAQKEAIILKVQGYTIPEIAKILYANRFIKTSNNNTVKRVLFTARSKLSKLVDRDGKLLVPLPQESEKPRSAKMPSLDNDNTMIKTNHIMAKLKSELDKYVTLHEKEYFDLIESKLLIEALKTAGVEDLPIYKAANAVLKNARIEFHFKPIQRNYR